MLFRSLKTLAKIAARTSNKARVPCEAQTTDSRDFASKSSGINILQLRSTPKSNPLKTLRKKCREGEAKFYGFAFADPSAPVAASLTTNRTRSVNGGTTIGNGNPTCESGLTTSFGPRASFSSAACCAVSLFLLL